MSEKVVKNIWAIIAFILAVAVILLISAYVTPKLNYIIWGIPY